MPETPLTGPTVPILAPGVPPTPVTHIRSAKNCVGCGTSVAEGQRVCASCAEKPTFQAPRGAVTVERQPEPRYAREGNFRRVEDTTPDPNDAVTP
jgi:hypothetical protein